MIGFYCQCFIIVGVSVGVGIKRETWGPQGHVSELSGNCHDSSAGTVGCHDRGAYEV